TTLHLHLDSHQLVLFFSSFLFFSLFPLLSMNKLIKKNNFPPKKVFHLFFFISGNFFFSKKKTPEKVLNIFPNIQEKHPNPYLSITTKPNQNPKLHTRNRGRRQ
ncbi:hypothetical protein PanWU01x14_157590, partial [Parasponia andersonii]